MRYRPVGLRLARSVWSAGGLHLVLTAACAGLVFLAARHGFRMSVAVTFPLAFAILSIVLGFLARRARLGLYRVLLLLDLSSWLPLLLLVILARRGAVNVAFWMGLAICLKSAVLLLGLGLAARQGRASDRQLGWLLCGFAFVFYLAPLPFTRLDRGLQLKGDEPHYMVTTISLVRDRDLYVEDEYEDQVYAPFYDRVMEPPYHTAPARGSHLAPFHDFGLPLLATIPYALGGWVMVLVAMALLAALMARETYLLTRLAGADQLAGLLASSLVGFSLPVATFATQIYPEIPAGLAIAFALRQMMTAAAGRPAAPLLAGLAVAALPWLHVRFWAVAVPMLLAASLIWRGWRDRVCALLPTAIAGAAYVVLNYLVFAQLIISPFLFNESVGSHSWQLVEQAGGLLGVILDLVRPWLDPYDGALWLAPIYVLALAAVPIAVRRSTWVVRGALATVAIYSAFVGLHYLQNSAGDSLPGRFLVSVLPLLAIPLALALRSGVLRVTGWLAAVLAAGGAVTLLVSLADPLLGRYPYGGLGGPVAILGRRLGLPVASILPSFSNPDSGSLARAVVVFSLLGGLAVLLDRVLTIADNADLPGRRHRAAPAGLR